MRACVICHRFSLQDPVNASLVRSTEELMRGLEHVHVVTLDGQTHKEQRPGMTLWPSIRRRTKLATAGAFLRLVREIAPQVQFFFHWHSGLYPILLMPWTKLTGKYLFKWKAHQVISRQEKLMGMFCDLVFTTNKHTYARMRRVRYVGQGIDTKHFRPCARVEPRAIVVGRICPAKELDLVLLILAEYKRLYREELPCDIIGPLLTEADHRYLTKLYELKWELRLSEVHFLPPVERAQLPGILSRATVFLNPGDHTGADRAALEAMSCGCVVLTSNKCLVALLRESPSEFLQQSCLPRNPCEYARRIRLVLSDQLSTLKWRMASRNFIRRRHSLEDQIRRIQGAMYDYMSA